MGIQGRRYIKNLGYLYIAFAHLSDVDLSEDEIDRVKEILRERDGDLDPASAQLLIDEILEWYDKTSYQRHTVLNEIIKALHTDVDEAEKKKIIHELREIAKADEHYLPEEANFINVLSTAFGLDQSDS